MSESKSRKGVLWWLTALVLSCLALVLAVTIMAATEGAEGEAATNGGIVVSVVLAAVAVVLWRAQAHKSR